ncbi:MAG: peptidoglycan D,D-transpeptidase FtsI family protein [Chordicoccus sp.]
MRFSGRDPEDTQREIGSDVRSILQGKNVRRNQSRTRQGNADSSSARRAAEEERRAHLAAEEEAMRRRAEAERRAEEERRASSAYGRRPSGRRRRVKEDPQERKRRLVAEKAEKKQRKKATRPYAIISYVCIGLFVLLIANLVYFNVYSKFSVLNSPYNKRQDTMAAYVVRGAIKSSDGKNLAYTDVASDGTETRVYPYANEYAHVVGYNTNGKGGLESVCNYDLLSSHTNVLDQVVNGFKNQKNPGDTVVSTLDSRLQDTAYNALGDYNGAVIVMEPKTGKILAMVSKPDFDPNTLASTWNELVADSGSSQLLNRATQGLYAPGSTFKIVTSLAYLRKHGTLDGFSWDCTGSVDVGDGTIHCYDGEAHGQEDYTLAFAYSCNTAFSQIGLDVGAQLLTDTAKSLLIGKSLPCDITASKSRWNLSDTDSDYLLAQTAFGQGKTQVTPYQMLLITSAVANNGTLMTPYLIDHTENTYGTTISTTKATAYKQLMTSNEASVLKSLMEAVVSEGTGSSLSGRSYSVAGKTGSAEYTKSDGTMGTNSWFVGFSNVDDPDIAVVAIAEDGGPGSQTAVPIASQIFDEYYSIH